MKLLTHQTKRSLTNIFNTNEYRNRSPFFPHVWFRCVELRNLFPPRIPSDSNPSIDTDKLSSTISAGLWKRHPNEHIDRAMYEGTRRASQFLIYMFLMAGPLKYNPSNYYEDIITEKCMITAISMALYAHSKMIKRKDFSGCNALTYYYNIIYYVCCLFEVSTVSMPNPPPRLQPLNEKQEMIKSMITCEITESFKENWKVDYPWVTVERFIRKVELEWMKVLSLVFDDN